jgi:predicted methyltransferase
MACQFCSGYKLFISDARLSKCPCCKGEPVGLSDTNSQYYEQLRELAKRWRTNDGNH